MFHNISYCDHAGSFITADVDEFDKGITKDGTAATIFQQSKDSLKWAENLVMIFRKLLRLKKIIGSMSIQSRWWQCLTKVFRTLKPTTININMMLGKLDKLNFVKVEVLEISQEEKMLSPEQTLHWQHKNRWSWSSEGDCKSRGSLKKKLKSYVLKKYIYKKNKTV